MRYRHHGLALDRLLLAGALLALAATVGAPAFRYVKRHLNESSAASNLRRIAEGCTAYRGNTTHYPVNLQVLSGRGLVDVVVATGTKSGYAFGSWLSPGDGALDPRPTSWRCYARPIKKGETGERCFFIDERNVVFCSTDDGATWKPY